MIVETETRPSGTLRLGTLEIDRAGYRAMLGDKILLLSRSQLELLVLLIENRHRVLSREDLAAALGMVRARSVDVLLSGLRARLGQNFVRNVRNRGWIVEPGAFER